ncbi:hypothetical protein [Rhodopseudomonas palustris]|uniref:hypothetical protein n=1 Tax=Rhodopseudomonas palustris TaxID=1076 RepID=UPI0011C39E44|nr:hypothetical protein [Rhodopseudomonas palustris]
MTQAGWGRSVAAAMVAICGIVALGANVAAASPAIAAPAAGEPVETAMAFMVYGSMAVGVVAGLITRAQR